MTAKTKPTPAKPMTRGLLGKIQSGGRYRVNELGQAELTDGTRTLGQYRKRKEKTS